jgi:peptidoglycan hydrolase-like amidase
VNEVAGEYLSYGGKAITAFYFTSSAGQTVSSASVWGGPTPYLLGNITSPETVLTSSKSFSSEDFRSLVESYNKTCSTTKIIKLGNNPANWLEIISKDSTGYVHTIRVGDQEISGNNFRYRMLNYKIKSHCFTFSYTAD